MYYNYQESFKNIIILLIIDMYKLAPPSKLKHRYRFEKIKFEIPLQDTIDTKVINKMS
jgi:hypothetical protein